MQTALLRNKLQTIALGTSLLFLAAPQALFAAQFEVSAWIPYWRSEKGVNDILPRLDSFTEV
ncbi:MAG: hypothetical protein WDZ90_02235, partial [Candidatus Paceibacterota bacterium]